MVNVTADVMLGVADVGKVLADLIPMAVSPGYGILFSTLTALVLAPAVYLITEDVNRLVGIRRGPDVP